MKKKKLFRTTAHGILKKGYVNTAQGQVHFGTAGGGPVLLLVHQSSSSMEEYAAMVPFLAAKYRLVLFDLPGHGMSEDPSDEPGVEEFTQAAVAVLEHLQISKCSILGHHGGALISMNFAHRFPKRTEKVILSGTSGLKSFAEKQIFSKKLASKKKVDLEKNGTSLLLAWQRYVAYMPEAELADILRPYLNSVMARMRPYDAHHAVLKWDRQPALEGIRAPVLLLQGLQDEFVSKQENLLTIIPNAQRKVLKNGGAFLFFDKAKECAELIDAFLSGEG